MTTLFEARFYCGSDDKKVYYVGLYGGKTKIPPKELINSADFIDSLFDQAMSSIKVNSVIEFDKTDKSIFEVTKSMIEGGRHLLLLWLGNRPSECKVISAKRVLPTDPPERYNSLSIPAIRYDLSLDSVMALSSKFLFMTILNRHLAEVSESDSKDFIDGDKYLRFLLFQDTEYLPPYAYSYLRKIDDAMKEHQNLLKACPSSHLPCEITEFGEAFFLFIKKSNWIEKRPFKEEDILTGD